MTDFLWSAGDRFLRHRFRLNVHSCRPLLLPAPARPRQQTLQQFPLRFEPFEKYRV